MDRKTKREIIATLIDAGRPDLANLVAKTLGELPDRRAAAKMAKSKGANRIRAGTIQQKIPGFKPHQTHCWIAYQDETPMGVITQRYKGLMGPSPIDWSDDVSKAQPSGKPIKI